MIAAISILIAMCGAALLLILFIRIRDTDKELNWINIDPKQMGFADLLVYAAVVEDGVIVGKNGSLMAAWVFCGDDTASSTETERERVSFRINQALSRLGNGWMIHVDAVQ
jgi:type IV secretory pathway VirB4 component